MRDLAARDLARHILSHATDPSVSAEDLRWALQFDAGSSASGERPPMQLCPTQDGPKKKMSEGIYFEKSGIPESQDSTSAPLARELAEKYLLVKSALEKARSTTHLRSRWHLYSEALDALHYLAGAVREPK